MVTNSIKAIWSKELRLQDFSDDDDFFSLGGHSLIMAKIQKAIHDELGVELRMDDLFRMSTVEAISAHIQQVRDGGATAGQALAGGTSNA